MVHQVRLCLEQGTCLGREVIRARPTLSREQGGATLAEEEKARRENAILDARADPAVAAILARFPGARIVNIRLPEAKDTAGSDEKPPSTDLPPEDDEED